MSSPPSDPPPAKPEPPHAGPAAPRELTLDEARERLEQHVCTTRWGWRGLARRLEITAFERSGAFDVIFASFTEKRTVQWAHRPYRGEDIDGPDRGRAPGPWEIEIPLPGLFLDQGRVLGVPHTESVKTCHVCNGRGIVTCSGCSGDGRVRCSSCGGDGRVSKTRTITSTNAQGHTTTRTEHYTESCWTCGGDGQVTCNTCGGGGTVTCSTCAGCCRLAHFQELHVRWATRTNSIQIEGTLLPDELIGFAEGIAILREEEPVIEQGRGAGGGGPYRGGNLRVNAAVDAAANKLIASHSFAGDTKLHRQRLIVRAVPVYEARYRFRKEERGFWIYGTDQNVHAPRFPVSPLRVGGTIGATVAGTLGLVFALSSTQSTPMRDSSAVEAQPIASVIEPLASAARQPPPPPEPPPPPPPLVAAKGPRPKAPPGKMVVELRTDPPGMDVLLGARRVGKSPLFLSINATPKGSCSGGTCEGAKCTGGHALGGVCEGGTCIEGKCHGALCKGVGCMGGTCDGGTCKGATCPAGYRCEGARCQGGSCTSMKSAAVLCGPTDAICSGVGCIGGMCTPGPCEGACTQTCAGGVCEPVTSVKLVRPGGGDRVVEIAPSDGDVIEVRPVE